MNDFERMYGVPGPPLSQLSVGVSVPAVGSERQATRPALLEPVRETISGEAARGKGESFRLRPRWPTVAQLDYVQKLATALLLVTGLLLLGGYALKSPRGALRMVAGAARGRVG